MNEKKSIKSHMIASAIISAIKIIYIFLLIFASAVDSNIILFIMAMELTCDMILCTFLIYLFCVYFRPIENYQLQTIKYCFRVAIAFDIISIICAISSIDILSIILSIPLTISLIFIIKEERAVSEKLLDFKNNGKSKILSNEEFIKLLEEQKKQDDTSVNKLKTNLEKIQQLKAEGVINEEEYNNLRKRIIDSFDCTDNANSQNNK